MICSCDHLDTTLVYYELDYIDNKFNFSQMVESVGLLETSSSDQTQDDRLRLLSAVDLDQADPTVPFYWDPTTLFNTAILLVSVFSVWLVSSFILKINILKDLEEDLGVWEYYPLVAFLKKPFGKKHSRW